MVRSDRRNTISKHAIECELAESLGIPNLVLWHTEDSNVAGRERLYKSEGKRYYSGNIYVPDDESLIAL